MVTFAHKALFGRNHLGCIAMMSVASCISFSCFALCNDMFAMLFCATRWLYMHLYTLACMSMHKSCLLVCRPCFNTIKLWTFDSNLHLSLIDTIFCFFLTFLPFCLFACFPSMLVMSIMLICFMPLSHTLCILSFHCLPASFLFLSLHVHT